VSAAYIPALFRVISPAFYPIRSEFYPLCGVVEHILPPFPCLYALSERMLHTRPEPATERACTAYGEGF